MRHGSGAACGMEVQPGIGGVPVDSNWALVRFGGRGDGGYIQPLAQQQHTPAHHHHSGGAVVLRAATPVGLDENAY
jgi:hypothetical protein